MTRKTNDFQTISSEGGLLPSDLLYRVTDPKEKLDGTQAQDYGLPPSERLSEIITQSWNRLQKHWMEFRKAAANLPENEAGTGLTNEKWNLPLLRELGFGLLPTSAGPEIEGRTYAINRFLGPVPIHLIGCKLSLDRRAAGVRGAAASNPHGLVQEFLNRSQDHLWALVSNGQHLRILRDNLALSRQSFLEFDLEGMFEGEVYSEFVLLWLVAHATRFTPREENRPETCWLEHWTKLADEQGTRALTELRGGVEKALQVLGEGFTSHPKNSALRDNLRTGELSLADFHAQLLRVVYRLIFLFVAEDRPLEGQSVLHPRDGSELTQTARDRYRAHYSTTRLRDMASQIKGSRHGDLWRQFQIVVGALSGDLKFAEARKSLALPILGSFLFDPVSTGALNEAELENYGFLEALRYLAFIRQGKILRFIDYKNLGAEELGGVYESLLALTPQLSADGERFTFAEFAGNARKTSGSYYTQDSLVQCLLDSALDPVLEDAIRGKKGKEAERSILALKVCDPAVGSGHFLVGAAHRLARHLARVRAQGAGESEPSPLLYQHALRDVIGHCLYGVDINPMAAELCRVSLWLEALEPGKPLSFLDHHIRVGNSLLGTTPELLIKGIPDGAFKAIEGDDKKACTVLKKRNKGEREGLGPLFAQQAAEVQARLEEAAMALQDLPDERPDEVQAKELTFLRYQETDELRNRKQLADAWCAAFVIKKYFREPSREDSVSGITQKHLSDLAANRPLPADLAAEVVCLAGQYQFFHWHLAFPEVFVKGGFDCVLGNPPWERVKIQEKEWFAERNPEISNAPNAAIRKSLIDALKANAPELYQQFLDDLRKAEGESHFLRNAGCYPLCGRGDINVFSVFAEQMRILLNNNGRNGCVLPTGIATDDTTKFFFRDLIEKKSLVSFLDFENREKTLFPAVYYRMRFCLITYGSPLRSITEKPLFAFFLLKIEDLGDPEKKITLSAEEIKLLNPNTQTCPIFRSRRDADITIAIYKKIPVLIQEGKFEQNNWSLTLGTMFHMANDSHLFLTREQLKAKGWIPDGNLFRKSEQVYLPLYEGRMIDLFDHRFASTVKKDIKLLRSAESLELTELEKASPDSVVQPRYWIKKELVEKYRPQGKRNWSVCCMCITSATNARTLVASIVPESGQGHSLMSIDMPLKPKLQAIFLATLNSFILDYVCKKKLSGNNITIFLLKQLPVLSPTEFADKPPWSKDSSVSEILTEWLFLRVLELTYTAWDLEPYAQDCGCHGPPFRWDAGRRFFLRCELDAAFFHLYLQPDKNGEWCSAGSETTEDLMRLKVRFPTPRDAVAYIMDTFTIVQKNDEEKWGEYRTKRVILEIYNAMQESIRTGRPYQTRLDPPPADPRVAHPEERPSEPSVLPLPVQPTVTPALPTSLPIRRVTPGNDEKYKTTVPLLDLKVAAGDFSEGQRPDFKEWVQVKPSRKLRKGMFVAKVIGQSMEPLIPHGAYCLFQFKAPQIKNNLIGLFQLREMEDAEYGGRYTVKKLKISTQPGTDGEFKRVAVLEPENPSFSPIPIEADNVNFVAEFLEVLKPLTN